MFLWNCVYLVFPLSVFSQILASPSESRNGHEQPLPIVYQRQELLHLRPLATAPPSIDIPSEISVPRHKCEKKGGIRQRLRHRKFNPPLPSIITGNSQSLRNKLDELKACTSYQYEYRDTCLMCFSETWFKNVDTSAITDIDGFHCERMDRKDPMTNKKILTL